MTNDELATYTAEYGKLTEALRELSGLRAERDARDREIARLKNELGTLRADLHNARMAAKELAAKGEPGEWVEKVAEELGENCDPDWTVPAIAKVIRKHAPAVQSPAAKGKEQQKSWILLYLDTGNAEMGFADLEDAVSAQTLAQQIVEGHFVYDPPAPEPVKQEPTPNEIRSIANEVRTGIVGCVRRDDLAGKLLYAAEEIERLRGLVAENGEAGT